MYSHTCTCAPHTPCAPPTHVSTHHTCTLTIHIHTTREKKKEGDISRACSLTQGARYLPACEVRVSHWCAGSLELPLLTLLWFSASAHGCVSHMCYQLMTDFQSFFYHTILRFQGCPPLHLQGTVLCLSSTSLKYWSSTLTAYKSRLERQPVNTETSLPFCHETLAFNQIKPVC